MSEGPYAAERARVLECALRLVPEQGFTERLLEEAAREAGLDAARRAIAFPGGARDLLGAYSSALDQLMLDRLATEDLAGLRIRDRIRLGIRARIEAIAPHLEAGRRAGAMLLLPAFAPLALELSYRTMDALWRGIGDASTDFSFYTKRALAAGVYLSTLALWFRDPAPEKTDTWRFLDSRIDDVMRIEKAKAGLARFAAALPQPFGALGALRYPDWTGAAPDEEPKG